MVYIHMTCKQVPSLRPEWEINRSVMMPTVYHCNRTCYFEEKKKQHCIYINKQYNTRKLIQTIYNIMMLPGDHDLCTMYLSIMQMSFVAFSDIWPPFRQTLPPPYLTPHLFSFFFSTTSHLDVHPTFEL